MAFAGDLVQTKHLKRSEDMKSISFILDGFCYICYGADNSPAMKGIMMMTNTGNVIAYGRDTDKSIFAYDWYSNNNSYFILSSEVQLSPALYDTKVKKMDLLCQVTCVSIGSSSLKTLSKFYVQNISTPIITSLHHFVSVDSNSKKPQPFPSWVSDRLKGNESTVRSSQLKLKRPDNTFIYHVEVRWSDTDCNSHCNNGSYGNFACDALAAAIKLRDLKTMATELPTHDSSNCDAIKNKFAFNNGNVSALKGISKEIVQRGLKCFRNSHVRECIEGDVLDVHIWQDEVKDALVYCSMENDDKVVAQMSLEYFDNKSKL